MLFFFKPSSFTRIYTKHALQTKNTHTQTTTTKNTKCKAIEYKHSKYSPEKKKQK